MVALRSDAEFSSLWQSCLDRSAECDVSPPSVPRHVSKKKDSRLGTAHSFSIEEYYRASYLEILDLLLSNIETRFSQKTFDMCDKVEQLILTAISGSGFSVQDLDFVTSHFGDDLDFDRLKNQLMVLPELMSGKHASSVVDVIRELKGLGLARRFYSEVAKLLSLSLVIPVSSATA